MADRNKAQQPAAKRRGKSEREQAAQRRRQKEAEDLSRQYSGSLLSNNNEPVPLRDFREFLKLRGTPCVRDLATREPLPQSVLSDRVRLVRPYILDYSSLADMDAKYIMERIEDHEQLDLTGPILIDLPFPEVWIEFAQFTVPEWVSKLGWPEEDAERFLGGLHAISGITFPISLEGRLATILKAWAIAVFEDLDTEQYHVEILGTVNVIDIDTKQPLTHTQFPKAYIYVGALTSETVNRSRVHGEIYGYLVRLLERIRNKAVMQGRRSVNATVEIGDRPRHRGSFKEVVYLASTADSHRWAASGLAVDWSHRWEVAGHWRRIRGIGKDREGRYVVKGATWVRPHEKGKKDVDATRKTRVAPP